MEFERNIHHSRFTSGVLVDTVHFQHHGIINSGESNILNILLLDNTIPCKLESYIICFISHIPNQI